MCEMNDGELRIEHKSIISEDSSQATFSKGWWRHIEERNVGQPEDAIKIYPLNSDIETALQEQDFNM